MRELKTGKEKTHVKELDDNSGNVTEAENLTIEREEIGRARCETTQSRGGLSDDNSNLSGKSGELNRVESLSLSSSFCEVVQLQTVARQ